MKKFFVLVLATILCASMLVISVPAAETNGNPTKILDESTFVTKTVISFDEEGVVDKFSYNSGRTTWELVDGKKGKALKMTDGSDTSEGDIFIGDQSWAEYDGLLWWLDLSGVQYNPTEVSNGKTGGVPIRITSNFADGFIWTRNTTEPIIENFDIATYYLADGTTEWKKSDNTAMNGERFNLPQQFVGWVYVPFTSYVSVKGPEGSPIQGVYGAESISKIMLLSGPHTIGANKSVQIVDEIQLVKLGTTVLPDTITEVPDTTAPGTTAPDTTAAPIETTKPADTTAKVETTAAPSTEAPAKKGCGSSITVASVAVVMTTVLGTACIIKKRRK